jgi:hypothetical protein
MNKLALDLLAILWRIVTFPIWGPFLTLDLISKVLLPGDSGWSLRHYERTLIDAAAKQLPAEDRAILEDQLQRRFIIQRLRDGRMADIHFKWRRGAIPRMNLPEHWTLAKFKVKSAGGTLQMTVGTHQGLIRSLHYRRPPKKIFDHPFEIIEAEYGMEDDGFVARALDRLEHGRERSDEV